MKRIIQPFAVEHKKRRKPGQTPTSSIWGKALTKELRAVLEEDKKRVAASSVAVPPGETRQAALDDSSRRASDDGGGRKPRILETRPATARVSSPGEAIAPTVTQLEEAEHVSIQSARLGGPPAKLFKNPTGRAPLDIQADVAASVVTSERKLLSHSEKSRDRVTIRRARMKGLAFEDRWRWDLIR